VAEAHKSLLAVFQRQWPDGMRTKFLLLPGGFLRVPWPTEWSGRCGWDSSDADLDRLTKAALSGAKQLLSQRVLRLATTRAGSVVFGVDVGPDAITGAYAEMVVAFDLAEKRYVVTGKSLPRSDQRKLVRIVDVQTHFSILAGERVLLLGCHDLNLFSPRGRGKQLKRGNLQALRDVVDSKLRTFSPTVVLQLPHGTDTPRTWSAAWNALRKMAPSIRSWASGISYYRVGSVRRRRASLDVVLRLTSSADCVDFDAT
jgi:hypothetical protein